MAAFEVRAVVNLGGPLTYAALAPLLDAGVGSVWLRAHQTDAALQAAAEEWSEALRSRGLRCIRSLALWRDDCGDGLHLRQSERPTARAAICSMGVHTLDELAAAEAYRAASVLVSPVFAPISKAAEGEPLGLDGLGRITQIAKVPCIALGGIRPEAFDACAAAGAAGVAVLGTLLHEEGRTALHRWLALRSHRLPFA